MFRQKIQSAIVAMLVSPPAFANGILPYEDVQAVQRGQQTYLDYCAVCHGENLEGQSNWRERDENGLLPAPPHDETGHTWHHGDLLLFQITKYGTSAVVGDGYKSNMPGFEEDLSDQQILDTLAYIKSTWSDRAKSVQNSRNGQ